MKNTSQYFRKISLFFVVFAVTSFIAYSLANTHLKHKNYTQVHKTAPQAHPVKVNESKTLPLNFEKQPPQNVSRDSESSPSGACFMPTNATPCGQ